MEILGNLFEKGEVTFIWKVSDFFNLPVKLIQYSPKFYFSGASWQIGIFFTWSKSNGNDVWTNLCLKTIQRKSPITVSYTFSIKTDGRNRYTRSYTNVFDNDYFAYTIDNFIFVPELNKKKLELLPSDILTIICTLETDKEIDITDSVFRRQKDVCDNLREIYSSQRKTDLELKFNDGESIHAHQAILETRSPVFAAMFNHDTKEKQSGVIAIKDVNKEIMSILLTYIYCGDMPPLTTENALPLYAAADKYDIEYVRVVCRQFLIRNLSVDWVTDVITFAELYSLEEVTRCAKDYFKENASDILKSDKWKNFIKDNQELCIELLSSLVQSLLPTTKSPE